jgi:hypothetical protein
MEVGQIVTENIFHLCFVPNALYYQIYVVSIWDIT